MDSDFTFGIDLWTVYWLLSWNLETRPPGYPVTVTLPLHSCLQVIVNQDAIICPWNLSSELLKPESPALQLIYSPLLNFSWKDEHNMIFLLIFLQRGNFKKEQKIKGIALRK